MSLSSLKRNDSNQDRAETKPLGIFWDIENCPIPLTTSASGVVERIRRFLKERHPECGFVKDFVVVTDIRRMSDQTIDSLNNSGVDISHVNSSAKNASDDKLQEHIQKFIDNFADKSPVLVIITGDINFGKTIRLARMKDCVVVLIFGNHCSDVLKNSVNESYSFDDIIDGVEEVVNSSVETKALYLKVCGLPKDKPIKEVIKALSRLLANCGGKPINYFDGSALIQFRSDKDCLQASRHFSPFSIFGQTCDLHPIIEGLNQCLHLQGFNICKSIIRGLTVSNGQNVKNLIIKIITDWNDSEVNQQIIAKVEPYEEILVVTAVSPGANQKLLNCAHLYLSPESGIEWTDVNDYETIGCKTIGWCAKSPAEQVADDRRSVIKGLSTRVDQDVMEVVKELVDSWDDIELNGSLIVSVQRNTKQSDTELEGKCNLFVTAVSADASRDLVRGAKSHIKESGVKWTAYKHKFQTSEECKSVIKGLPTTGVKDITQFVKDIVRKWSDPRFRSDFIVSVERNTYQNSSSSDSAFNLFVTATTPHTSRELIRGAKQYLKPEHNVRWIPYEPKTIFRTRIGSIDGNSDSDESHCSFFSTNSSVSVVSNITNKSNGNQRQTTNGSRSGNSINKNRLSIITGLYTKKDESVLRTVRKLVSSWRERNINGNIIEKVERDPIFSSKIDGNIPLFVTTFDAESTRALVSAAKRCLPPNSGIKWAEYGTDYQNPRKPEANKPPLLPYPPFPPNYGQIIPQFNPYLVAFQQFQPQLLHPNPLAQQLLLNSLAQVVHPFQQTVHTSAQNINQKVKKAEPLAQTSQNSKTGGKVSANASSQPSVNSRSKLDSNTSQSSSTSMAAKKDSNHNTGAKPKTSKASNTSPSSDERLSLITGLKVDPYDGIDGVTRTVRRLVANWKDSTCNGNYIVCVEVDQQSGAYKVWTHTGYQTDALVAGAQLHLIPNSGIVWTHSQPKVEQKSRGQSKAKAVSLPNKMFVIIGLKSRHNEDVLLLVRELVVELFDGKVRAEDVVGVTRDCKWKSKDGKAMLFVTVVEPKVKDLVLKSAESLETDLQFKDYNGFKH